MTRNTKPLQEERHIALCYVRQSYTRNETDMNSPERQRANIAAYCAKKGWTPEWHVDAEGHKSGRYVQNRPGWLAVEQRLKDPDVAALVANDLARLHRKTWRIGQLMDRLDEYGVHLVLAEPGREIDTSTPGGRMLITVLAMQDEAYANDISQRAKASISYRKAQGKTVGLPPFGTIRDKEGFLQPTTEGAWLLADGRYVPGEQGQQPPEPGAVWRGYYDCAGRILEVYADNRIGLERVSLQIAQEGWAYRDRWGEPRTVSRADVRRVVALWRVYAGLSTEGRNRDKNASKIDDPLADLYQTGREVFPYELLSRVAKVQKVRSITTRPFGGKLKAHTYPLAQLLFCAACEQTATEQGNLHLKSRLQGWNKGDVLRYRHAEVACSCKTKSVATNIVEDDFRRLIGLLTVDSSKLEEMTELALQSEYGGLGGKQDDDLERQKAAAIAKCKRRIAAAQAMYLDGDLAREEYLKRKDDNERQIAHWQSRTTETEQAAMELRMCMEALERITRLWDSGEDEDKQQLARMIFDHVVYDLDLRQIVDFRLKPWADRYLVLRAALYNNDDRGNDDRGGGNEKFHSDDFKSGTVLCPQGDSNSCLGLERASSWSSRRWGRQSGVSLPCDRGRVKAEFGLAGAAASTGGRAGAPQVHPADDLHQRGALPADFHVPALAVGVLVELPDDFVETHGHLPGEVFRAGHGIDNRQVILAYVPGEGPRDIALAQHGNHELAQPSIDVVHRHLAIALPVRHIVRDLDFDNRQAGVLPGLGHIVTGDLRAGQAGLEIDAGAFLGPAQCVLDAKQHFFGIEGLGDEVIRAQLQRGQDVVVPGTAGQEDDRDVCRGGHGPQVLAHLEAIHVRQDAVHQDQMGHLLVSQAQCLLAVLRVQQHVAVLLQEEPEHFGDIWLVLDQQDASWRIHRTAPRSGQNSSGGASLAGASSSSV